MKTTALLATIALGSTLPAQLSVYPFTETDVGVYATDGKTPALATKAKAKLFPNTDRRDLAKAPGVVTGADVHRVLSFRGVRIRHFCFCDELPVNPKATGGTTTSTTKTSIKQGAVSYNLNVRMPFTSTLVISATGATKGSGKLTFAVDFDADNKIDFSHTVNGSAARKSFSFKGGNGNGTPRKIRVTVNGSATWQKDGSNYDGSITLWIQKPVRNECAHSKYGKPCDVVGLLIRDVPTSTNRHVFTATISNAPKNAGAILGVGFIAPAVKLPGIPCQLLTAPLLYLNLKTDVNGEASVSLNLNFKIAASIYGQAAVADTNANTTRMSNGLRLDCFDK